MSSNASWTPGEGPRILFSERCWFQGALVSAMAYGITVSLYLSSFDLLVRGENRVEFKKRLPLLTFITLSFLLGTLYMITLAAFTQMAFIDDRNFPGGPSAFERTMFSMPIDQVCNAAFVLSNWLSDGLLLWRFKVIYQSSRVPIWIVMLFPCLMLAGSVAMGIMCLIQDSSSNPYSTNGINFTLPYGIISLTLNIILTIAIVLRLMVFRYNIVSVMGPDYGTHYVSVAAMIVESAAFFSAICIAFLVLFGMGNDVSQVFLQSLSQFQTIASLLIVFRVAQGKGWTEGTAAGVLGTPGSNSSSGLGTMRFAPHGASFKLASSGYGASSGEASRDSFQISNDRFREIDHTAKADDDLPRAV